MNRCSPLLALLTVLSFLSFLGATASSDEPSPSIKIDFDIGDLSGRFHSIHQNDLKHTRVFVFLSTSCPISNSYIPELNRIYSDKPMSIDFFGVISDASTKRDEAVKHSNEFKIAFPVLFDSSGLLANQLSPTHVPEAFVIDANGQIRYRGAIDNAYESLGRRRANVEHHFLRDALLAIAKGTSPYPEKTNAIGCRFPSTKVATDSQSVTYNRDVAPILFARCLNCHRAGEVAPFELSRFEDAKQHSEMIVEVTQRRLMPPWMPSDHLHDSISTSPRFVGDRRLTDHEIAILKTWSDNGCPEGDPADLPVPPRFVDGWQLGEPDIIARMREPFTVPADGPDLLHNFVIPINIPEDKLIAAIDFHPGNRKVVHHAVLFLDDKGQARKLESKTAEPGYGNFGGPGFLPSGALGGWSVGNTPRRLPNEMGRYLKKGSDLVIQVHYHPTGKMEVDQSEVGIYFVNKPVTQLLKEPSKLVGSIWMANYEMDIPAGEKHYQRSTRYTLPRELILVGVVPHMHLLGKSMSVTATLPDGTKRLLINVPEWNFNWQDEYYLEHPFSLPANTTLEVTATFDNSVDNPSNPSSPPRRVTWGEETTDEMLYCFFLLTAKDPADLIHVIFDNLAHDGKQVRGEK